MDITSILEKVDSEMFGIWFLIGAALVFFMQCGFAMVETGCLTSCSVLQRQLLFPVQWRSVQSFQAIVFIRQ